MGADALIGTMAGNYKLVERLGAGGMGEVYKGVHATIGSKVAIKLLHAIAAREHGIQERFLLEAQAVNRIEHDGVVKIIDAGRLDNGRPFLVMELLQGESLQQIRKRGPMPIDESCKVMIDVLDALEAAHRAGVVHRDLKPPNVFRTKTGRTIVLDFGIAKLMAPEANLRLTLTGMAVGTPHYMAPEQIRGQQITPSVDIYAAGVMLFALACGRHPFEGDEDASIFEGHLTRRPPPPRALEPNIPVAVQDVILKALAKEPAQRYASAAAMRDALRAAIHAPAPAASPPAEQRTAQESPHRNPWARPTGNTPKGRTPPDDVVTVPPPARIPDTQRDRTPAAVVAHRERSRLRWIIAAGAATSLLVVGIVLATADRGDPAQRPLAEATVVVDARTEQPPRVTEPAPVEEKVAEVVVPPPPGPKPIEKPVPVLKAPANDDVENPFETPRNKGQAKKPTTGKKPAPHDLNATVNPFGDAPKPQNVAEVKLKEGDVRYDLGEFEKAIVSYKESYSYSPTSIALLKIAHAYRELKKYKDALFFYKRYAALETSASKRREVEIFIQEMQQKVDDVEALSTRLK